MARLYQENTGPYKRLNEQLSRLNRRLSVMAHTKRIEWAYQAALEHDLSATELSVLLRIAHRAGENRRKGMSWETQDAIAIALKVSRSTVNKAILVLEQLNLVLALHRFADSTMYVPACNLKVTPICSTARHPLKELKEK